MTAEWPGLPADRPGRDPGASLPDAVLPGMGLQGAVGTAADPSGAVPGRSDPRPRPVSLRLARLHLRTGSISLARAELEAAAGAGELDGGALLDLAEVRWRTADVIGAGEAADAYLDAGGDALVALIVAAEAATMSGAAVAATAAAALVERVVARARLPLDRLVAGMPLGAPWPAGMDVPPAPPETARDLGAFVEPSLVGRQPMGPLVQGGAAHAAVRASGVGSAPSDAVAADPHAAFAAGTEALAEGDRDAAALYLAVTLRLSPSLAPAILASVGGTPGPAFDLLRGDAFRLVGHESDARRAYAAVARSLGERRERDRLDAADAEARADAEPGPDAGSESDADSCADVEPGRVTAGEVGHARAGEAGPPPARSADTVIALEKEPQ